MNSILPYVCQIAVLLVSWHWAHSTSGFLMTWLGLGLVIDEYLLRCLPWTGPRAGTRELGILTAAFVIGTLVLRAPPRNATSCASVSRPSPT